MPFGQGEIEHLVSTVMTISSEIDRWISGPRIDGAPFDSEDIRLFQLATNMISREVARTELSDEVKNQERELASIDNEVQQVQQHERAEMSSYLHDEPLQKIAYALGQMRERSLPEDLAGILEEVARDLRTTSASLSPDILRSSGLVTSIGIAIEEQRKRSEFSIFQNFSEIDRETRFQEEVELAIYRAVQEGLTNARKHADAKAVWVQLSYVGNVITASVDDNGIGLGDALIQSSDQDQNLGLRGLRRRIQRLGGSVEITARATRGTSLKVNIPADQVERFDDLILKDVKDE